MKYRLMDLLACPICKTFPLRLIVLTEYEITPPQRIIRCELYCAYHNLTISDDVRTECSKCYSREIREGVIFCSNCGRWYPIDEEIPRMLPDELRNKKEDISFLDRWRKNIPSKILYEGRPFSLDENREV